MRTSAERHKRAGEIAEFQHQFDLAAHEFFQASRHYRSQGRRREAEEMRVCEMRALAQTIVLADSARDYEAQAERLTKHASQVARKDEEEPDDVSPELYTLAGALYEEAASRYIVLADRAANNGKKPDFLRKAANDLERAAKNLSSAACRSLNAQSEEDAADLFERAKRLDEQAVQAAVSNLACDLDATAWRTLNEDGAASTQLALAWLRKLARTRCKICDRRWIEYVKRSRTYSALLGDQDSLSELGKQPVSLALVAAAEWQKISSQAVLDHEASHEQKTAHALSTPDLNPAIAVSRAS